MSVSSLHGAWPLALLLAASASLAQPAARASSQAPLPKPPVAKKVTAHAHTHTAERRELPPPRGRAKRPPTPQQAAFKLPDTRKARTDLADPQQATRLYASPQRLAGTKAGSDCSDMNQLASYSGDALANYVATLPDYECTYGLFSLTPDLAATVFTASNLNAVAARFSQEAAGYNASNMALVNLTLFLRAAYYVTDNTPSIAPPPASLLTTLRAAMQPLVRNPVLFQNNDVAPTTPQEVMTLITNMHDDATFLPDLRNIVARYTNTPANPNAAAALLNYTTGNGFTGVLNVIYDAHYRPDSQPIVSTDPSYTQALNAFVVNDKSALLGGNAAYQLSDAANEAFRFLQYPALKATVKPEVQNMLATTSMTGADAALWLDAAEAVDAYDSAACADYGTCNYKDQLAAAVLAHNYTCSPTIHIRSQAMTSDQLQQSCAQLATEESYFHQMMQTNQQPVKDDNNTSLEVVVFNSYADYQEYSPPLFGNSTDNGGIYLEGEPDQPGNQARFIAYRADWLTDFQVWNLTHEYVHYLDGRFDMYGDFATETSQPDVWYIEGLAEYISKKNVDQPAIDAAKTGQYPLSTIFGDTYDMPDYVNRAYNWGYMATRFMFEKHRSDIDAILPLFRAGNYAAYEQYMQSIGTRYDAEFASWVQTATTDGEPPLPGSNTLPPCANQASHQLANGCSIQGLASSTSAYAYIILPQGAKNLKLWTSGGTGDVDLYVANGHYPTARRKDQVSSHPGNDETVVIPNPVAGSWYYIQLKAVKPFSGVAINATYQ
jgi:microbial collagenase